MEEKLNERLKFQLKEQNMTQKQLAQKAGLTEANVSKYISGSQMPNLDTLIAISKALKVSLAYLAGEKDDIRTAEYDELFLIIKQSKNRFTFEEKMRLIKLLSE